MRFPRLGRRELLQAGVLMVAGSAEAGGDNSEAALCPQLVGLTLRLVRPGDMVTMDYREDRVTIEVDDDNVIQTLSIG